VNGPCAVLKVLLPRIRGCRVNRHAVCLRLTCRDAEPETVPSSPTEMVRLTTFSVAPGVTMTPRLFGRAWESVSTVVMASYRCSARNRSRC
jgi:hypothetical protein